MTVEKRLIVSHEEAEAIYKLRDKLEELLLDEDEFFCRDQTTDLYNALYAFCKDVLEYQD